MVVGAITSGIAAALRERKPELLALFPEPPDPFDKLWSKTLDKANAAVPDTWFGMPWDWNRVDAVETRFFDAKAGGNLQAAKDACRDYIALMEHFGEIEQIHAWADATPAAR